MRTGKGASQNGSAIAGMCQIADDEGGIGLPFGVSVFVM